MNPDRVAVIKNGVVINVIMLHYTSNWQCPLDCSTVVVTDMPEVDIGYLYDGNDFSEPPPPIINENPEQEG